MKSILLSAALFCAGCATIPVESGVRDVSEQTAEEYTGAKIRRWSPIVSNLDDTMRLFTDILGFELASLTNDPQTSYVFDMFNIDRSVVTRHAVFHAGPDQRVLSVVEVPGLAPVRSGEQVRRSALLINANGRFDEIRALLSESGYETIAPHRLGSEGIEMGFIDRDGHLYALYEIPYSGTHSFEN